MNTKFLTALIFVSVSFAAATSANDTHEQVAGTVAQIQRADYEGNRAAMQRGYDDLKPFMEDQKLASRVRYWRGFAQWRRAINGFNEAVDPKNLEKDLNTALDEFKVAMEKDPTFVDAKVGTISCLGFLAFMNRKDQAHAKELVGQILPLVKEADEMAADNPRLIWVHGPILWNSSPERGGGQDKAIQNYQRGLEVCSTIKTNDDPIEPSWGKPELMMSLAYCYLNMNSVDPNAAERYARNALEVVPYWHYVRDILLPQIVAAKAKLAISHRSNRMNTPNPIDLLFAGMDKLSPGEDSLSLYVLRSLPEHRFGVVVDAGCGAGRQTFVLADELKTPIDAVDSYQPFLDRLRQRAKEKGVAHLVRTHCTDMKDIPTVFPTIDLLWAEGAAYNVGFANALATWAKAIRPDGFAVVSELCWLREDKIPDAVTEFFRSGYPEMQSVEQNIQTAEEAGYELFNTYTLPKETWVKDYYDILEPRAKVLVSHSDVAVRNFAVETLKEIETFKIAENSYGYVFYVLQRSNFREPESRKTSDERRNRGKGFPR